MHCICDDSYSFGKLFNDWLLIYYRTAIQLVGLQIVTHDPLYVTKPYGVK